MLKKGFKLYRKAIVLFIVLCICMFAQAEFRTRYGI